jgi:hypothetical protein
LSEKGGTIMLKLMEKKQKSTQYIVGGAIAVVVLFAFISIPLMQTSSRDSAVDPNSFFRTRTADVNSLGGDIPPEGAAPGYSLNGGMLNNPVTSGENIAATLFQSGPYEEGAPANSPADQLSASAQVPGAPSPMADASAGAPPASGPRPKMAAMPSTTAGNANSMTAGGTHDKFFGSGTAAAKKDELPAANSKLSKKPDTAADKRNVMVAGLEKMGDRSLLAAKSISADQSRDGATSAFVGSVKPQSADLNTAMEQGAAGAGLGLGEAAQDLKRNDPQLSSKRITVPEPVVDKDAEADEEMKKMILQMLMSSLLGGLLSGN